MSILTSAPSSQPGRPTFMLTQTAERTLSKSGRRTRARYPANRPHAGIGAFPRRSNWDLEAGDAGWWPM